MAAKKVAIVSVSSILLVAMVAAVVVGVNRKSNASGGSSSNNGEISTANKAVQTICQPTDYKQTCESTLAPLAGDTTNPKDLVKIAFNVTVSHIEEAMKKSAVLQEAAKDPSTSDAFKVCDHLLDFAVDDLRKSMDRIGAFDPTKLDEYVSDLKTWLSGVVTYQEDCKEAFDNTTTGDSGKKMKELLKTSDELIRNALAMVDEISGALKKAQGVTGRRLLGSDGLPTWIDAGRRSLLQAPANYNTLRPNVVVSQSGKKGHFKSINAAINAVPPNNNKPFVIFVEPGVYHEYVLVPKTKWNVVLLGAGPSKTKITGDKSNQKGVKTMYTATVAVEGRNFFARGILFENSAGPPGHQAVALRVTADMAIIQGCEINAYQDTLYTQSQRQFYTDCTIVGTVDFIFGDARAVFQKCKLVVRKPGPGQSCMVTAQGRTYKRQDTGYVIQRCSIVGTPAFKASREAAYLGRPWKELSRTIIMQTFIDDSIRPDGWAPWEGSKFLNTCFYGEYANTGPGANTARRVRWPCIKKITPDLAASFSARVFIGADQWIRPTAIPYIAGV